MFEFIVTLKFVKSLESLDLTVQQHIKEKLEFFSVHENPLVFAKKLKGYKDLFRFRTGDFRIIFRLSKTKIFLLLAKHRKNIYEGL